MTAQPTAPIGDKARKPQWIIATVCALLGIGVVIAAVLIFTNKHHADSSQSSPASQGQNDANADGNLESARQDFTIASSQYNEAMNKAEQFLVWDRANTLEECYRLTAPDQSACDAFWQLRDKAKAALVDLTGPEPTTGDALRGLSAKLRASTAVLTELVSEYADVEKALNDTIQGVRDRILDPVMEKLRGEISTARQLCKQGKTAGLTDPGIVGTLCQKADDSISFLTNAGSSILPDTTADQIADLAGKVSSVSGELENVRKKVERAIASSHTRTDRSHQPSKPAPKPAPAKPAPTPKPAPATPAPAKPAPQPAPQPVPAKPAPEPAPTPAPKPTPGLDEGGWWECAGGTDGKPAECHPMDP